MLVLVLLLELNFGILYLVPPSYCHSVSNIFTFCSGKPPPLVFLQGSPSFIGDLLAHLSQQLLTSAQFMGIILTYDVPLDGYHKFNTKDLISHFHVGGTTDGSWWYHDSDLPLVPSSAHKDVQRSLIGCLRST